MLTRDIDITILSVRPSVCHVPVLYPVLYTFFSFYGSPIILVFPGLNIIAKFVTGSSVYRWGRRLEVGI